MSPREAFDGKILVDGADDRAFRLRNYGVEGVVGNRAAARDCREAASATAAHASIHSIAMQVGAIAATARGDSFRKHFDDCVELRALEIAIGISATNTREKIVFLPVFSRTHGDDLLRENILRRVGNFDAVEIALSNGANQGGAFKKFISRCGEDSSFRNRAVPVAGASDALQSGCDRARRADLANQINRADIDTKLERSGRNESSNFSGFQLIFRGEAELAREAAVMRGDRVFAKALFEMMRHSFREAARVDEHERRAVLANEHRLRGCKSRPTFRARRPGPSSLAGTSMARSSVRWWPIWTITGSGRPLPVRKCAISSIGFCVAERPMRTGGVSASASSRSSESARCAPRLSSATA